MGFGRNKRHYLGSIVRPAADSLLVGHRVTPVSATNFESGGSTTRLSVSGPRGRPEDQYPCSTNAGLEPNQPTGGTTVQWRSSKFELAGRRPFESSPGLSLSIRAAGHNSGAARQFKSSLDVVVCVRTIWYNTVGC